MSTNDRSANPLYPFNWLDAVRAAAWDPPNLPLYSPRAAPSSWDRFPLAQPRTEDSGDREPNQVGLTQGLALAKTAGPDVLSTGAEVFGPGVAHAPKESVASDIFTKAFPGGLAGGAIGFAGAPADTNQLHKTFGSKIGDVLGISPETQSKIGAGYDLAAKTGLLGPLLSLGTVSPTSDTIKNAIEEKIGPLPEARTVPGQYVQTGAELLPALLGNKGSLIRGLATQVAVPAIVSETAGQLTKGTAVEPYTRMLGAVVGGVAGAKLGDVAANARFARTAPHASRPGNVDDVADVVPPITREAPPIKREPFATDGVGLEGTTERLPHQARATEAMAEPIVGPSHIEEFRARIGVPTSHTVAVGRTNVPSLETMKFEGASRAVRKDAGLPPAIPGTIRSPAQLARDRWHAEEDLFNQFDRAVEQRGLLRSDVEGKLVIHVSNPRGVCPACLSGLNNAKVRAGVIKQFSALYPKLTIEISVATQPGIKLFGYSRFAVRDGKYIDRSRP
jgi:hypothetical protein